jgi:hypothetical protein
LPAARTGGLPLRGRHDPTRHGRRRPSDRLRDPAVRFSAQNGKHSMSRLKGFGSLTSGWSIWPA